MYENHAVSEIIGTILIIVIAVSSISAMFYLLPVLEDRKAAICASSLYSQFDIMDVFLHEMIAQGETSSKKFNIAIPRGNIEFGAKGEQFIIYYSLTDELDFNVSNFDDNSFNFSVHKPDHAYPLWINVTSLVDGTSEDKKIVVNKPHPEVEITFDSIDLNDAIKIDLMYHDILLGRIWIFDLEYIKYMISSPVNTYEVIMENGGVYKGHRSILLNEPLMWNENDYFIMRIIKFDLKEGTSISGNIDLSIDAKINKSSILEFNNYIPCLKMQIVGDYARQWIMYFKNRKNFNQYDNGILYTIGKNFSLIYSEIFLDYCPLAK